MIGHQLMCILCLVNFIQELTLSIASKRISRLLTQVGMFDNLITFGTNKCTLECNLSAINAQGAT